MDSVSRMCSKYLISLDLRSGIRHASLVRMTHQRATYYIYGVSVDVDECPLQVMSVFIIILVCLKRR